MDVFSEIRPCRDAVRRAQSAGKTIGLIPTMGALHDGHVSLVRAARARCSCVAVTIFVNPAQFAPGEDFDSYPRTLERDLAVCEAEGVDLVFTPRVETMYPDGSLTKVHVERITDVLCGPRRPGHFDGVTTIVVKLFHVLPADLAFFGEKDYQQIVVIKQMVRDLNLNIEIVACPTVREPDGLATSSRNAYLSAAERGQAAALSRAIHAAADRVAAGERNVGKLVTAIRGEILKAGPAEIEYVDVVDAASLEPLTDVTGPARICVAARIGGCRLIDNVGVDAPARKS